MKTDVPALVASSIGAIAAELLDAGGEIEVLAAFERSVYLLCQHGIVCIGVPAIGRGPINVLVPDKGQWSGGRAFGLHEGIKGVAGRRQLSIGPDLLIATQGAPIWTAPPFAIDPPADALSRGLAKVRALMRGLVPTDGVSALLFDPAGKAARTPTAKAAAPQIDVLTRALPDAIARGEWSEDAQRSALLLLGLGPGLTPSGDDFLGGLMLALTACAKTALRDALWETLAPELDDLTVPVSAMHLSAAADGMGAEVVHDLINAMRAGDDPGLAGLLGTVLALGATSGADTIAGIVVGLSGAASVPVPSD